MPNPPPTLSTFEYAPAPAEARPALVKTLLALAYASWLLDFLLFFLSLNDRIPQAFAEPLSAGLGYGGMALGSIVACAGTSERISPRHRASLVVTGVITAAAAFFILGLATHL